MNTRLRRPLKTLVPAAVYLALVGLAAPVTDPMGVTVFLVALSLLAGFLAGIRVTQWAIGVEYRQREKRKKEEGRFTQSGNDPLDAPASVGKSEALTGSDPLADDEHE